MNLHLFIAWLAAFLPLDAGSQPIETLPKLRPGPGWSGPTVAETLPGAHADATVIAHMTRMQRPILWRGSSEFFEVGVLAYHRSGIERVSFSVDDGPWVPVTEIKRARQTGHYGYVVGLDKDGFGRGWHELRAVCTPRAGANLGGTERVLSWRFYNGAGERPWMDYEARWVNPLTGSDAAAGTPAAPFATVARALDYIGQSTIGPEGAVVFLMSDAPQTIGVGGSFAPIRNELPLTITAAAGYNPRFRLDAGNEFLPVGQLAFSGIEFDVSADRMFRTGGVAFEGHLYFSACHFEGFTTPRNLVLPGSISGLFEPGDYGGYDNVSVADSTFDNIDGAPATGIHWMRGTTIRRVRYDGLFGVRCAIDTRVIDVAEGSGGGGATGWQPHHTELDVLTNVLLDGCLIDEVEQHSGELVYDDTDGVALVNSLLRGGFGSGINSFNFGAPALGQGQNEHHHTLVLNCSFPYSQWVINYLPPPFFMEDAFPHSLASGVIAKKFFDDNTFGNPSGNDVSGLVLDLDYIHLHQGPLPAWSNWTLENEISTYVAPFGSDFHIKASSASWGRVPAVDALHPFDITARRRGDSNGDSAIGAFKGQSE